MERCGSFAYTRGVLVELHAEVLAEVAALGGHAELAGLVDFLHRQVADQTRPPPSPPPASRGEAAPPPLPLGPRVDSI